jgi:hypothetical protein
MVGMVAKSGEKVHYCLLDKNGGSYYIQSMTATAQLLREIETMPEATAVEVLDFAKFIKGRHAPARPYDGISIKDAHGIFKDLKGMDTTFERDEDDRY